MKALTQLPDMLVATVVFTDGAYMVTGREEVYRRKMIFLAALIASAYVLLVKGLALRWKSAGAIMFVITSLGLTGGSLPIAIDADAAYCALRIWFGLLAVPTAVLAWSSLAGEDVRNLRNRHAMDSSLVRLHCGLVAPVCEELLFRAILQGRLQLPAFVASVLFALGHYGNSVQVVFTFVFYNACTLLARDTSRWMGPLLAHVAANAVGFPDLSLFPHCQLVALLLLQSCFFLLVL